MTGPDDEPPVELRLRPMTPADHDEVLRINEASVHFLSPLTGERLVELAGMAVFSPVVEADGRVVAFALAFGPGVAYASPNYRWWSERRDDFLYLDRIVVDEVARGRRVGSVIYDALEAQAAPRGRVVAEVNTVPFNGPSLGFHDSRGYTRHDLVGDAGYQVVMVEKVLP